MNVQVTIKIDRESITELAGVFREFISADAKTLGQQIPGQPVPQMPQQVIQPEAVPQAQVPQAVQPVPAAPPAPQGQTAYSAQIAQKIQLPPGAVTGSIAPAHGLPTTAVPQEYTQDQMAVALAGLVSSNRGGAVAQILAAFGVQALEQIPKERYPELALKLREAGANI